MNISGIPTKSTVAPLTPAQQLAHDMKALHSALQQGNVHSAKTALTAIKDDLSVPSQAVKAPQPVIPSSDPQEATAQALQALESALQKRDITAAQAALNTLQGAVKTAGQQRYGGAVSGVNAIQTNPVTAATDADGSTGPSPAAITEAAATTGTFLNVMA